MEKTFDLIAVVVIAAVGLFIAYVTFGILDSQADAKIKSYSVSGAIAGALISISLLASVYMQLRKSSIEVHELRSRNKQLESKVIRGAPKPKDFEIEVAEPQHLVLARPRTWEPKGGVIFNFEKPESDMKEGDIFPAQFTVSFTPTDDPPNRSKYAQIIDNFRIDREYTRSFTSEMIYLGDEPIQWKALK